MEENQGELVAGRYRVLRHLGQGGMGEVVVARHETIGRDLALKRMRSEHAAKPDARARMLREARAMGALRHENIVDVIDAGEDGSGLYIAMELVAGETLRDRMKRGVAVPLALDILAQIADGLAAAHDVDVVHRDLKPENVMITPQGRAKILDFGLARDVENADTVTEHGVIVGTPGYIAPEVGTRGAYGVAADVYALGVIAFELFTGKAPYTAPTGMSLLLKHMTEPAPTPNVSPDVDALVLEAMAKEPEKRPTPRAFAARCRALAEAGSSPTLTSALRTPDAVHPPQAPTPQTAVTGTVAPVVAPVGAPQPSRMPLFIVAGVVALGVMLALGFFLGRPAKPDAPIAPAYGIPDGALRAGDVFPVWPSLARIASQKERLPQKWTASQWGDRTLLVVVVPEPCTGCVGLLDDLERLRAIYPTVGVTLVIASDSAKIAVDAGVVERASMSTVDIVTAMTVNIGERPDPMITFGYKDRKVAASLRGLAARGNLERVASELVR